VVDRSDWKGLVSGRQDPIAGPSIVLICGPGGGL
jgi:hypothetical protein